MPYCPECGADSNASARFCNNCGAPLGNLDKTSVSKDECVIWEGKPYMKEMMSNTTYTLTNQRLIIKRGMIRRFEDQIDLVRIKDLKLSIGISDRMMGIGQIEIISSDPSTPSYKLVGVRDPRHVRDLMWQAVTDRRRALGVRRFDSI